MAAKLQHLFVGTHQGIYRVTVPDGQVNFVGLKGHFINHLFYRSKTLLAACPEFAAALHGKMMKTDKFTNPNHVPGLHVLHPQDPSLPDGPWSSRCVWQGDAKSCSAVDLDQGGTRLLVGTEPADVYVSDDGGGTWSCSDSFKGAPTRPKWYFPPPPHLPHTLSLDLALDPKTNNRLLVAGVEVGGCLVSADLGRTWQERSEGLCIDVHSIRVDPLAPSRMFAVTGGSPDIPGGLYRSDDAGQSWNKVAATARYMVGLALSSFKAGEIAVTAGNGPPSVGCHVHYSTDGGQTFQQLTDAVIDGASARQERTAVPLISHHGLLLGCCTGEVLLHGVLASSPASSGGSSAVQRLAVLPAPITCLALDDEMTSPSSICH